MSGLYRGRGPKVFISYGFGNALAAPLARTLENSGFWVTLIDRQTLVGEQDLGAALRNRIGAAEVLIPILDAKANRSEHVNTEIQTAKELGLPLVPIVQSEDGLHETIRKIPYTFEPGPLLSDATLDAIASSILKWYPLLELDADEPYQFAETTLHLLFQRDSGDRTIRILLDSKNVAGGIREAGPAVVEKLTKSQPESRSPVNGQLRRNIESIIATQNIVEVALIQFREAIENLLQNYGVEGHHRQIAPWQRLLRLLTSDQWRVIFRTLPPSICPELWHTDGRAFESALTTWHQFEDDNAVDNLTFIAWSLSYPAGHTRPVKRGEWTRMTLADAEGGTQSVYLPSVDRITRAIASKAPPARFLEPYEWADFVIPQLLAGLVRRSVQQGRSEPVQLTYWRMSDFELLGR